MNANFEFKVETDNDMILHVKDDLIHGAIDQANMALEAWLGHRFPKEVYGILRKRTDASRAGDLKQVERYENDFFVLTGLTWDDLGKEIEEKRKEINEQVQETLEQQIHDIEREAEAAKEVADNEGDASSESVSS